MRRGGSSAEQPWLFDFALRFERFNLSGVLQGLADVIKPLQQASLAEGVDLEADPFSG